MSRSTVVIEVSPSRLEVAVVRSGRVVRSAAVRHDTPDWESGWPAALSALKQHLSELVTGLDAVGRPAAVLVASPSSAVNVHACPASAGASAAASAATLALGNILNDPLSQHPAITMEVFRDRRVAGPNEKRMRHMLAAAESDATAEAIGRWVGSAGLQFIGLLPLQAVESLAAAEASSRAEPKATGVRAVLWIGEHQSVLAVGSSERMRFVRPIALGTETLIDALTRPIVQRDRSGESVTLTRDEARAMLSQFGIPQPTTVLDTQRGLDGLAILPLLQPALQRLGVEVKQSLRFGLSESERNDTTIQVLGHGGMIPQFRASIERHLAATDARPQRGDAADNVETTSNGEFTSSVSGCIAAYLSLSNAPALMLPSARSRHMNIRRTRIAMRIGMAACIGLVAIDGGAAFMERLSIAAPASNEAQRTANVSAAEALASVAAAEQSLIGLVRARLGEQTPMGPWLASIAEAVGGQVRLVEVRSDPAESGMNASIRGVTIDAQSPGVEPIREFINALAACPAVSNAALNHTQRSSTGTRSEQAFEVGLKFHAIPAWSTHATASLEEIAP